MLHAGSYRFSHGCFLSFYAALLLACLSYKLIFVSFSINKYIYYSYLHCGPWCLVQPMSTTTGPHIWHRSVSFYTALLCFLPWHASFL